MRKAVEEYLEGRGCRVVRPPAEPAPPTLENLVDGFLAHVLRLDPESYRRAFWYEAYRNGHTLGHVPRTFGAFFSRNARTFEQKVSLLLALAALFGVYTMATLLHRRLSLLVKRLRRPTYYEKERERRRKLAEARREIRRHHTLNPKPAFDAIRAALLPALEAADSDSAPVPAAPVPAPTALPVDATAGLQMDLARARETAREILGECEGTLISLEAALALRLDPDCIPANGEKYVRRPGCPRIPKKVIGWLARRRVA
ncbi:MAG: hypothetical protein IJQ00_02655 [Kiritimatiellae bacterium]|nr:hypothetical protein [Kiritimatiellia bacterium]